MKLPRLLHRKILYCSPVNHSLWAFCFFYFISYMNDEESPLLLEKSLEAIDVHDETFDCFPVSFTVLGHSSMERNCLTCESRVRHNLRATSELINGQVVGEPIISGFTVISKGIPIWIESTQKCLFMWGQFDEMRILNLLRRNFYLEYEDWWGSWPPLDYGTGNWLWFDLSGKVGEGQRNWFA